MLALFFEGRAFAGTADKPLGKEAVGNPAVICFTENLLPENVMRSIAQQTVSPMTTFLAPGSDGASFDIRYFTPNGTEVDLCGHATLVATYFIKNFVSEATNFTLNIKPSFHTSRFALVGEALPDGVAVSTRAYTSIPYTATAITDRIVEAMGLNVENVERIYETELKDYIFILRSNEDLRKAQPDFDAIIRATAKDLPHRVLTVSAPSTEPGFDYESRVFIPLLGINEDIACGSANCSLAPIWAANKNKETVKMFYCTPDEKNEVTIGGIQEITVEKDRVQISSNVIPSWSRCLTFATPSSLTASKAFQAVLKKVSQTLHIPLPEGRGFDFLEASE